MSQALIFDAEGVVIDTEPAWDRSQEEFLRRRGLAYDRERIKPLLTGRSLEEGVEALKRELGLAGDTAVLARERADLVRQAFAGEAGFIPGFEAFFQEVRDRYRVALATALDPALLALIDTRLALSERFRGQLYTVAQVGHRGKPRPDVFLAAAQGLGVDPVDCLVIEDAPHGIEAARRAGMRCIGLATTYPPDRLRAAECVVADYTGVRKVLGRG